MAADPLLLLAAVALLLLGSFSGLPVSLLELSSVTMYDSAP